MAVTVRRILIVGLLSVLLAMVALFVSYRSAFAEQGHKEALIAAFPVTERVTSGINFMLSQKEDGCVEVKLPAVNCRVWFWDRYVETSVARFGQGAVYGLHALGDFGAPADGIECQASSEGGQAAYVHIERTAGAVSVSRAVHAATEVCA